MRKFKVTLEILLDKEKTEKSVEQYMERKFGDDLKYVEAEYMPCDESINLDVQSNQRIMNDFYKAVDLIFMGNK